jgi:hypothetical protein
MTMNILCIMLILTILGCSKQPSPIKCTMVYLISSKYTLDGVLFKTDTLWKDCIGDKELDKIIHISPRCFKVCYPFIFLECLKYNYQ